MTESGPAPRHRIVFTPSGLSGSVDEGTTVLEAARQLGVDLDSVCGGRGLCGRCQVVPSIGEFAKWSITALEANLSPAGALEASYAGARPIAEGHRLGCGVRVRGDVVIDVPAASQLHRQVVIKDADIGDLRIDPVVTLHYLAVGTGNDDPTPIAGRIRRALAEQWAMGPITIEPDLLPRLHALAAAGDSTVAIRGERVVAAWPGFVDRSLGVAIDVGSTTVAGHLCDLATGEILATAGTMNPQIRFGEDLMSRVSYAMMNDDGATAMTTVIRAGIDGLIGELLAGLDDVERTRVLEVVVVGNPIMHHLVLGIDPTPLGQAPFPLATADAVEMPARSLGLDLPSAALYVAPCIAGHVGADTVAAIVAEGPHRARAIQLLVDVGTNAEIVVGNRERLLAASSPTGPAFEGAQISCGQRATTGAIERVRIDRRTLVPRYKVIGSSRWSDDPAFAAEAPPVTGICGSGVIEAVGELFLAGLIDAEGVIVADGAGRSPNIVADDRTFAYHLTEEIRITQGDVRAIQLAKAALRAGIELLLEKAGIDAVDEIRLAGAFGAHIDPLYALVLGLVPDCPLDQVRSVGNAAGSGAVRALLSGGQRREMEAVARSVVKIETATEPRFQDHFVAALAFPHRDAPTPNLASTVDLPERRPRGRRRRRATGHLRTDASPAEREDTR